jgi:hypothetical protein
LKDTYTKLKQDKPNVAAEYIMTKALQQVDPDISIERAKRIIYGKKEDMS